MYLCMSGTEIERFNDECCFFFFSSFFLVLKEGTPLQDIKSEKQGKAFLKVGL